MSPTASAVSGLTPGADAAIRLAGDRLVQPQRVAPEGLVAEGVVAEGPPSALELGHGVVTACRIDGRDGC